MLRQKIGLILIAALGVSGCGYSHHHINSETTSEGLTLSTTPDSTQVAYVKASDTKLRYCAETNIDYTQTQSKGLSTSFGLGGSKDSIGDQSSEGAVSFGGRDPAVLIARELMFRACEFNANTNANDRMALTVYAGTLDAIVKIALSQQGVGTQPTESVQPALTTLPGQGDFGSSDDPSDFSGNSSDNTSTAKTSAASVVTKPFDWSSAFDYSGQFDDKHP